MQLLFNATSSQRVKFLILPPNCVIALRWSAEAGWVDDWILQSVEPMLKSCAVISEGEDVYYKLLPFTWLY